MKHVVRKGEYLAKVAAAYGLDPDAVWNDPGNVAVKASRDPNVLNPGDLLTLPEPLSQPADLTIDDSNQYEAVVPDIDVEIRLAIGRQPLPHEPFAIESPNFQVVSATDGEGIARFKVGVQEDRVLLILPRRRMEVPLRVGYLQTVDRAAGQKARLQNLGFLGIRHPDTAGSRRDDEEGLPRGAVMEFQSAYAVNVTGVVDDDTQAALKKAYGR